MTQYKEVGGTDGKFFKFTDPGTELEGIWHGTKEGSKGPLGIIEDVNGVEQVFGISKVLSDKVALFKEGDKVKIIFVTNEKSKSSGMVYKVFRTYIAEGDVFDREPGQEG